jgi:DNA-binding transcriptional MerR regulator
VLMSGLAARTEVGVPTIKYYLREGVLMPGRAMSATRAEYGEAHVRRIAVIKALSGLGLSMVQIKSVVGLIDEPGVSLFSVLGAATGALPSPAESTVGQDCSRARAALEILGCALPEGRPVVAQLEQALADAEAAGVAMSEDRLRAYAPHIRAIAAYDIDQMPMTPSDAAVEYAVLGTVLYEPILAALRQAAHAEFAARRLNQPAD